MMAGNPNWWSTMNNGMHPQQAHDLSSHLVYGSSDSDHQTNHEDFPVIRSWSQLLLGGLSGGEEDQRFGGTLFQQQKKLESINIWEQQQQHQLLNLNPSSNIPLLDHHVKQENIAHQIYNSTHQVDQDDQFQPNINNSNCWPSSSSSNNMPVSSPTSCITTLSNNNILNFSGAKQATTHHHRKNQQHNQDHSCACNSTSSGGVSKKARVQQSSAQPALKVRKEKLGDRITALHQIVSPFGKTDTASVLSEAIGYIRFLQGQIEALSSPYMRNGSGNHQHSVQERNCLFPEEACQFLNDIGVEGRGASKQESSSQGVKVDLRSRGLCLVPISLTQHVGGNENGADYWAPAALGSGF